ncbi:MAG: TIGR02757 family protein [Bacteroides sp.]|nr:TIGR02757 family protein [Bacteroides sp.]MCM1413634.1 TIGR02757 family protein [Bacteroides sp.]MCM1471149.1 TIGR02757 family protein [Bacteroides sp.]
MTQNINTPQAPTADIVALLDSEAARINSPTFIADDPVQFPRMFSSLPDIEIAALLSASIAWGNRTMICRNCGKMLALMGHDPHRYVMDRAYEDLPDGNIHRTFFARNLRHFLRGLHRVYSRYDSLNDFARHHHVADDVAPAWRLVQLLNHELAEANGGVSDSRCLPLNLRTTALKRVNMALRWLVRRDGIVDLGVWDAIAPSQLYIPLDVHVGNTARDLGLITRKSADRRTVEELTAILRTLRPDDPCYYDYALFGIGIESKQTK